MKVASAAEKWFPFLSWIKKASKADVKADLMAGLTCTNSDLI
ncbi:hypothetical protein [Vibrio nigripulchritudo]|nr:hypothetical protein [Vibrio nigripulchritudo]